MRIAYRSRFPLKQQYDGNPSIATEGGRSLATQSLARQLRVKRSEMMVSELEAVALRLFEQRGFDITVEGIASEAQISVRTFYRYFPAKDDVL